MIKTISKSLLFLSAGLLLACSPQETEAPASSNASPQTEFMANLRTHCGQAYSGALVSNNPAHIEAFAKPMTMHVICTDNEIRIPFYVEDDRSRNWIFTQTETGLRLKHLHNYEDGREKVLSQYGGDTVDTGTANRQEFPADTFSKDLFVNEDRAVSATNIWAVEITPEIYAYELTREGLHFRVEFDLTKQVPLPPKPW